MATLGPTRDVGTTVDEQHRGAEGRRPGSAGYPGSPCAGRPRRPASWRTASATGSSPGAAACWRPTPPARSARCQADQRGQVVRSARWWRAPTRPPVRGARSPAATGRGSCWGGRRAAPRIRWPPRSRGHFLERHRRVDPQAERPGDWAASIRSGAPSRSRDRAGDPAAPGCSPSPTAAPSAGRPRGGGWRRTAGPPRRGGPRGVGVVPHRRLREVGPRRPDAGGDGGRQASPRGGPNRSSTSGRCTSTRPVKWSSSGLETRRR